MSFTKKHISSKTFCIIDIGSFKLRGCVAKFKNRKIEIVSYKEKRQDISYFSNNECLNVPGLCENISELISSLEEDKEINISKIILSYPFGELFLESKNILYKRKKPDKKLSEWELVEIFESIEKLFLDRQIRKINDLYALSKKDLSVVLWRINSISIDGKDLEKIQWTTGERLKISLVNGLIPKEKQTLMTQVWNVIGKTIYRVLPSEYCISKLFSQRNILIINMWATQTSLTYKKNNEVIGVTKIPIGIHSLIDKIAKKHKKNRQLIFDSLSEDNYREDKDFFLSVWGDSLGIALKELLWKNICPKNIFLWGWGGTQSLVSEYMKSFDYNKYEIQFPNQINFVKEDISEVLKIMENIQVDEIQKISLDMYSLLIETHNLISGQHDTISTSFRSAIKNLWYTKN